MMPPVQHNVPPPAQQPPYGQYLDHSNLLLIYVNSLLFSGLFAADSIAVFLVRAVFNGLGIIMVLGLISLLAGNIIAGLRVQGPQFAPSASYYSHAILLGAQLLLLLALCILVAFKHF